MRDMDLVELAPGMGPTRDFVDRSAFIELLETGEGVGLQSALVVLQVLPWVLSPAIWQVAAGAIVSPEGRSSRT